jgi:hypothetical protein
MKEELNSSETSVPRRATRRNIPEDAILHDIRRTPCERTLQYCINSKYDLLPSTRNTLPTLLSYFSHVFTGICRARADISKGKPTAINAEFCLVGYEGREHPVCTG